jgi:hypothetical protein
MQFSKASFFLLSSLLVLLPAPVVRLVWISKAQSANGTATFMGKTLNGQFSNSYTVIRFLTDNGDTVFVNGPDEIAYKRGETIPLFYPPAHPEKARVKSFSGLWLDLFLYSITPFLFLMIAFLHPHIIPAGSTIIVGKGKLLHMRAPQAHLP